MLCLQASSLQSAAKIKAGWAFRTSLRALFPQEGCTHTRELFSILWGRPAWQGGHSGHLSEPFSPRKDAHTNSSSPSFGDHPGPPRILSGVVGCAGSFGRISQCIYWRPQQSFSGPEAPAGAEGRGSSAALIYTEPCAARGREEEMKAPP